MAGMKITLDGVEYSYNGSLMLPEAIAVEQQAGLTPGDFQKGLLKGSATALGALIWILMRRKDASGTPRFAELSFDINALEMESLGDDGLPLDLRGIAARVEELEAQGTTHEDAMRQAHEEETARHRPNPPEPVDPQVAGSTGVAEPPPIPSIALSPDSSPPSPTTTESIPGNSIS
jgi:hypothetical protein